MRRLILGAAPLLLLIGAACGDGPDKSDSTPAGDGEATPTRNANEQPQVPDTPVPNPTPIPNDLPVVQVAHAGKQFSPTQAEFAALPKVSITANGRSYEGVTLSTLTEKAGGQPSSVATIQGTRVDNLRLGAVRFTVSEVGDTTVFFLVDGGHLALASSSIPADQWLKDVTGIGLLN